MKLALVRVQSLTIPDLRLSSYRTGKDAAAWVHPIIGTADREHFVTVALNSSLRPIHAETVSIGTLTETSVHPREVFKGAMLANAHSIIVAHNHPSGDVSPSPDDWAVTERLRKAGEILGIALLDHVIVTHDPERFYVFSIGGF